MYFLTYEFENRISAGLLKDGKYVLPLENLLDGCKKVPGSLLEFIRMSDDATIRLVEDRMKDESVEVIPLGNVRLKAPIPYPQRDIICLGKNYLKHAQEIANTILHTESITAYPIYFSKFAFPAIGTGEKISSHEGVTSQIDYEAELAVIIGKGGRDIQATDVENHIFGYTIINDVTARDLQNNHSQWFRGKSLDTFCPMGPYIAHRSLIPFPVRLDISCTVNGELRQSSNTANMIFDIPYVISQLSRGIELKAGDIIATGTPEGVGLGFKPPRFLKHGDKIVCKVERIGVLENIID